MVMAPSLAVSSNLVVAIRPASRDSALKVHLGSQILAAAKRVVQTHGAMLQRKSLLATPPMAAVAIEVPAVAIAPRAATPIAVQVVGNLLPVQVCYKACQ